MKKYMVFACMLFCITALQNCKSNGGKGFTETSDTLKFFPVIVYFKGQIARVDSFAGLITKIAVANGIRDTSVITKQQFNQWAQNFTSYDISDKSLHKYYKENVFADQTTQSLTFNYTAMDSTLPLQTVDVLLDQNGQQVKNIFLSKNISVGDSTVTEKCGWQNDKSFFINRSVERTGKPTTTQQNIIVWQFQP